MYTLMVKMIMMMSVVVMMMMMMRTVAPSSVQIAWINMLFPEPSGPASNTDLVNAINSASNTDLVIILVNCHIHYHDHYDISKLVQKQYSWWWKL